MISSNMIGSGTSASGLCAAKGEVVERRSEVGGKRGGQTIQEQCTVVGDGGVESERAQFRKLGVQAEGSCCCLEGGRSACYGIFFVVPRARARLFEAGGLMRQAAIAPTIERCLPVRSPHHGETTNKRAWVTRTDSRHSPDHCDIARLLSIVGTTQTFPAHVSGAPSLTGMPWLSQRG